MGNRRSQRRTWRPDCEALESRELLSASHDLKLSVDPRFAEIRTRPRSDAVPASILNNLTLFQTVSTVPANGDLNPYGVAFVPSGFPSGGLLTPGDILVSNFNNSTNLQGTGTTIVDISPSGSQSLFFQDSSAPGLDTALGVLKSAGAKSDEVLVVYEKNLNHADASVKDAAAMALLSVGPEREKTLWMESFFE